MQNKNDWTKRCRREEKGTCIINVFVRAMHTKLKIQSISTTKAVSAISLDIFHLWCSKKHDDNDDENICNMTLIIKGNL